MCFSSTYVPTLQGKTIDADLKFHSQRFYFHVQYIASFKTLDTVYFQKEAHLSGTNEFNQT